MTIQTNGQPIDNSEIIYIIIIYNCFVQKHYSSVVNALNVDILNSTHKGDRISWKCDGFIKSKCMTVGEHLCPVNCSIILSNCGFETVHQRPFHYYWQKVAQAHILEIYRHKFSAHFLRTISNQMWCVRSSKQHIGWYAFHQRHMAMK